jgi:transposase-like protein
VSASRIAERADRNAAMVAAFEAGASVRQLERRFGVSFQRCHQIVTQYGTCRIDWTEAMDARLRRLRARGVGVAAAAARIGVTEHQLRARLRAMAMPCGYGWRKTER